MQKKINSPATRIAIGLYCLVGGGLLGQGLRYLFAEALMDYHLAVIGVSWEDLGDSQQKLMLGLLQGFGAGAFCVGLAVIVLALGPLRSGTVWARWLTPGLAGAYAAMLYAITGWALLPGAAPITVTAVLFGLVCVAWLCSVWGATSPIISKD